MFRIIDLDTNFCIGFGYSNYSEKEAFEKAISMVKDLDLELNSLRLDKYYSSKKVIRMFNKKVTLYLYKKHTNYELVGRLIEELKLRKYSYRKGKKYRELFEIS